MAWSFPEDGTGFAVKGTARVSCLSSPACPSFPVGYSPCPGHGGPKLTIQLRFGMRWWGWKGWGRMDLTSHSALQFVSLETTLCWGCSLVGTHRNCWELARKRWETTHFPKWCPRGRWPCQEGTSARALHAPGPDPESSLLPGRGPPFAGVDTHKQEHRVHQLTHCSTRSMWKSWETGSSEPSRHLLQPETGGTASQPSLSLLLEPSLGWTATVSINTGVRETEYQFKNV